MNSDARFVTIIAAPAGSESLRAAKHVNGAIQDAFDSAPFLLHFSPLLVFFLVPSSAVTPNRRDFPIHPLATSISTFV